MGTGSLGNVLLDAQNKVLMDSFDRVQTTWDQWCAVGSAPDFKTINMVAMGTFCDWERVYEGAPIKYGSLQDKKETATIKTYGRGTTISREMFINDDLSALTGLLQKIGIGAATLVEDLVYNSMTASTLVGPSTAETGHATLFVNGENLIASGGTVSVSTLGVARKGLRKLATLGPDDKGQSRTRYTGLMPKFLLTGIDNETTIDQVLGSQYDPAGSAGTLTVNPFGPTGRNRLTPIFSEALQYYLDAQSKSNGWYLIADKNSGFELCKVFFLNGRRRPVLEKADAPIGQALGMSFQGYFDVGVGFPEWRAGFCNAGS